ncbi:hypothetical protein WAK64_20625 [Bacillus spongiae]|uniref:Uncharacterized protein n=1 Tax=Bacillus spongiae TaxID=2683610 RepID=A0ABU8HJH7_9BACI
MKKFTRILAAITLALTMVVTFSNAKEVDAAESGWKTYNGISANVYTDRTGDYPVSDSYIGATGLKTSAGGTVYYRMELDEYVNGAWYSRDSKKGSFSSQTPMSKFYIDEHLVKGESGTFRVMMKIFSDSEYDIWVGDWITDSFTVHN